MPRTPEPGEPVFPMEELKVKASDVPGEVLATTQRLPLLPPPFARPKFTEDLVTTRTPAAEQAVREEWRKQVADSRGSVEGENTAATDGDARYRESALALIRRLAPHAGPLGPLHLLALDASRAMCAGASPSGYPYTPPLMVKYYATSPAGESGYFIATTPLGDQRSFKVLLSKDGLVWEEKTSLPFSWGSGNSPPCTLDRGTLVGDARVDEIARMSGGQLTDAARAHARELLSLRPGSRRRAG